MQWAGIFVSIYKVRFMRYVLEFCSMYFTAFTVSFWGKNLVRISHLKQLCAMGRNICFNVKKIRHISHKVACSLGKFNRSKQIFRSISHNCFKLDLRVMRQNFFPWFLRFLRSHFGEKIWYVYPT